MAPPEDDLLKAATTPLTFHDFLDRMRHPSASDLVRSIKSFIVSFMERVPDPDEDSKSVQEFIQKTELAFHEHVLWAGASQEELESSGEGLEKYLMTKLFSRAFAALPEDESRDLKLTHKIDALQTFMKPEHLDIPNQFRNEASWLLAQKELQKLGNFKAPRDKLVCILNCCRVINNLLINASMAENSGNPPGADDFLPLLIYVVIKANPPQLHSNLLYISKYRQPKRLVAESAYFYTNLVSAVSFIEQLDASSLSMDAIEFEKAMDAAIQTMKASSSPLPSLSFAPSSSIPDGEARESSRSGQIQEDGASNETTMAAGRMLSNTSSDSKLTVHGHREKAVEEITLEDLESKSLFKIIQSNSREDWQKEFSFLYCRAEDLRVGDVESLLREYKELALKYSSLRHAITFNHFTNVTAMSNDFGSGLGLEQTSSSQNGEHVDRHPDDRVLQSREEEESRGMSANVSDASSNETVNALSGDAREKNSVMDSQGKGDESNASDIIEEKSIVMSSETDVETKNMIDKFDDKALDND